MKEADLQRAVRDYLQYKQNLGELYFDRLNSGVAYIKRGDKYYAITLCETGTADFMVLTRGVSIKGRDPRAGKDSFSRFGGVPAYTPRTIFLELKGEKGKQRPEQVAFQKLVEAQGCSYFVIRSIEDLEAILEA